MEENLTPIAIQNANALSKTSLMFCLLNGINPTPEVNRGIAEFVSYHIQKWYAENDKTYSPTTEPIEPKAVGYAFGELEKVVAEAQAEAQAEQDAE